MHLVIGFLGSLVTILYLLDRLGIDLGGLNPFHWYRRRAFAQKYGADPIYSIEDPIHVASLMVIGAAKLGGDLTQEQKQAARNVGRFSRDQADSMVQMMSEVSAAGGQPTATQQAFIEEVRSKFMPTETHDGTWS